MRRKTRNRRALAAALSVLAHLAVVAVVLFVRLSPPPPAEPKAVTVQLIDASALTRAAPAASAAAAAAAEAPAKVPAPISPARTPPKKPVAKHVPAPPERSADPAGGAEAAAGPGLSGAQIAGAATADSGPAGRTCNMARRVQDALRRDALVQAAVAGIAGKAVMVWDGDWVRSSGEDGKGLAAVREAIMWEIAFAPEACRTEPVHGLVLLSTGDGPGAPRLALGTDQWRWSQLLTLPTSGAGAEEVR